MTRQTHYFAIQTADGYCGQYATRAEAEHARRRLFGIRALAHPIVRVNAFWAGGGQSRADS